MARQPEVNGAEVILSTKVSLIAASFGSRRTQVLSKREGRDGRLHRRAARHAQKACATGLAALLFGQCETIRSVLGCGSDDFQM